MVFAQCLTAKHRIKDDIWSKYSTTRLTLQEVFFTQFDIWNICDMRSLVETVDCAISMKKTYF